MTRAAKCKVASFPAMMNQQAVRVIVDTGSTLCWIDPHFCELANMHICKASPVAVSRAANNISITSQGNTTALLNINHVLFPVGFCVTPLPDGCDCILGYNWLTTHHGVVEPSAGRVVLRHPLDPAEHVVWLAECQTRRERALTDPGTPSNVHAAAPATDGALYRSSHDMIPESAAPSDVN